MNEVKRWVKKYFPGTAHQALVMFSNEYNDEGYDVAVQTILVFDTEEKEVVPHWGYAIEARKNLPSLDNYIYEQNELNYDNYEWNGIEDLVVELTEKE